MLLYSYKKYGANYNRDKSSGEIIKYPETERIHRITNWDKRTIILGEMTTGRGGYVTYEFSIPEDVLSKARHAELFINKLLFFGRRKYAVAKIEVGNSRLYFIQDALSKRPSWRLFGGFLAKKIHQKRGDSLLKFCAKKSCLKIPLELLSKEFSCTIEVGEMQQIIIYSVELKIYGSR